MNIGILEAADFSPAALQLLQILGNIEIFRGENLTSFVAEKEVLFVRLKYNIDRDVLLKANRLKYICSPTTGLNHIDTAFCVENGIEIISLKGETTFLESIRATPEHSLGLLIALKRNYSKAFLNANNNIWNRDPYRGFEIYGSKVGIIGYGRVGKILSSYLIAMGAECCYYDIEEKNAFPNIKRMDSISELIHGSDTVFLCSNYTPKTNPILGKNEIDAMQGKYFINTARAELTDESYLVQKASLNHFKGIAIDVIQNEQSENNLLSEWLQAELKYNIILTPHIGGATFTSMERTEMFVAEKLKKKIVIQ